MNNNKEICILNDYTIYAETNYFIVVTYTGKINLYDVPDKNIGMLSYNPPIHLICTVYTI